MRAEGNRSHSTWKKKLISSCRACIEHYSNKPTDPASSRTSSELKEALCNSAGEKIKSGSKLTCGGQEKMNEQDSVVEVVSGCSTEGGILS